MWSFRPVVQGVVSPHDGIRGWNAPKLVADSITPCLDLEGAQNPIRVLWRLFAAEWSDTG